ncbi:L-ribulose-5-phosphate 3-epimerase [Marinomonas sp. 15G1-11]|uniref:L-ribulose-5-phosphate 3-epimerase n=1 Tax=Marinomonas phaeophyticola TaxID=3004091 RepID=A0ABT4JSL1_9GAMM|nr:L-ribulose-5-phosphate 3-epimerase [Marinomonas sp. 15G1-11]MCZ2721037.1 L-ribulose-5-phosphate 3-epimerase [Marinomonas sp. 15G1-11]
MIHFENKFRLGIYEKALPADLSWRERLSKAKELGFDFLEISVDETDARQARLDWSDEEIYKLRDLCIEFDMPLQSMCLSAHRKYPFGSMDNAIRERSFDIMEKAIALAFKLGIRCIQMAGYDVYYEPQSEETHRRFVEGMQKATKMAERAGIMLGVEIMDTPYLNSLSKFEVLKRDIPSPFFMAYPDVGNISGWNHHVPTELKLGQDHIVQIHLKDTLRVSPECKGQFRDLVIGEGEVDFHSIFKTLAEIDYAAPFVIEMWAQNENWFDDIKKAKERLITIAHEAGLAL